MKLSNRFAALYASFPLTLAALRALPELPESIGEMRFCGSDGESACLRLLGGSGPDLMREVERVLAQEVEAKLREWWGDSEVYAARRGLDAIRREADERRARFAAERSAYYRAQSAA